MQPTGSIHLGNYFGAIKNWVGMQEDFDAFYCVAQYAPSRGSRDDPEAHRKFDATQVAGLPSLWSE